MSNYLLSKLQRHFKLKFVLIVAITHTLIQNFVGATAKGTFRWSLLIYLFALAIFALEDRYPKISRWIVGSALAVYPFLAMYMGKPFRIIGALAFFQAPALQFVYCSDLSDVIAFLFSMVLSASAFLLDVKLHPSNYQDDTIGMITSNPSYRFQVSLAIGVTLMLHIVLAMKCHSLNKAEQRNEKMISDLAKSVKNAKEDKENFILRFSHEIRNPLNSLLGNIDILTETSTDPKLNEIITAANVCGELLLQLLNNILDSAKISEGKLEIALKPTTTATFFEKIWVVCSEMIRVKKLYGAIYMNDSVPSVLNLDSHRISQIMINLTSNATKFTDRGYVTAHIDFIEGNLISEINMKPVYVSSQWNVRQESDENTGLSLLCTDYDLQEKASGSYRVLNFNSNRFPQPRKSFIKSTQNSANEWSGSVVEELNFSEPRKKEGFLRIEINDSGCGMDASKLNRLFNKFTQVNDETTKRQIGTGLGLWITKEIIELLKGEIRVYSGVEQGTCFVIAIKTETADIADATPSLRTQSRPSLALQRTFRALVLEHSPYNQEIKRRFLTRLGFEEICIVGTGDEGVKVFKARGEGYFSLIISDVQMPVLDGLTACAQIRQFEKANGWNHVPLIIVTGHPCETTQQRCLDPQGDIKAMRYLTKPASFYQFKEIIDQLKKEAQSPQSATTVLVADDDPFNLKIMKDMITRCGKKVITASNGKLAVEEYTKNKEDISLIFMDCEMPVMNGMEASRKISTESLKRKSSSSKQAKIIGLTGHMDENIKNQCRESGMTDVYTKPINLRMVQELLQTHR